MFTVERALAALGDADSISSGDLLRKLDADWLRHHGSMQQAGYALAQSLGVRPERMLTERGWRSYYHRRDLEAARTSGDRVVTTDTEAEQPASIELPYCAGCGAGLGIDGPCWRCGLQP
jgi:hypothetical protein